MSSRSSNSSDSSSNDSDSESSSESESSVEQKVFSENKTAEDDGSFSHDSSDDQPGFAGSSSLPRPSWMDSPQENNNKLAKSRVQSIRDIIREAANQPDLYCVRRSCRPRNSAPVAATSHYDNFGIKERSTRNTNRSFQNYSEKSSESSDDPSPTDSGSDYSDGRRSKARPKAKRKATGAAAARKFANAERWSAQQQFNIKSSSSGDDESDADFEVRHSASSESEMEHFRRSQWHTKRSTMQAVSYKEQSSDDTDADDVVEASEQAEDSQTQDESDAETIEKVLRHRIGRKGATGSQTVSYVAENEGDPNDGFDPSTDESEVHYLIKWKGWAHIHNTWESEKGLREQKVNGLKRLDNYIKNEEMMSQWRKHANIEELEYLACQQEMTEDLQNVYCQVERVIRCKTTRNENGELSSDYFVKWQGLPYAYCTEEDGHLIDRLFPKAVDEYHSRLKSACTPTPEKFCRALKTRPKFIPFKDQPSWLGGEDCLQLRDYQLEGLNWLLHSWCRGNSAILADEMGLGKTIQTISFLSALMNSHAVYGPFLLLVPLSTIATWLKEFRLWAPQINAVEYIGDATSRSIIRDEEWCHPGNKKLKFNVLITTYEILLKDKDHLDKISWAVLGVDEAHRLKNDDSMLYKCLISFKTNHRLLITGTPLQNSLRELWALLHFLMPDRYARWEDFEERHKSADKTGFQHLHSELQPFLLRRVKKDVEKSLPAKVEQILRVEMSKLQKKYYKWILTKNYKELSRGSKCSTSSFVNIAMELKKCCNHAFLVCPADESEMQSRSRFEMLVKGSGKLILLDKLLLRLKESGHRVLIFSQMVRMLDILAEYLKLRRFPYQRLDGSIRGEIRKQAMDHFNAEYSQDFCFLLSTRAGGLGVNLATADTVIIFDSDWNPQNDLQAQARAHRIGQKNQVSVYRLVTKNSMEEDIIERAKKKMVLDHLVIQRMDTTGRSAFNAGSLNGQNTSNPFNRDELNAILKFGAEELFKETEDDDELQVDIDDILRVAEQRTVEESKNSATDELLSQFKVVSFDNLEDEELEHHVPSGPSWENIIPEVERRRIDDEELHRQLVALNPPPRSRKTVNKTTNAGSKDVNEKSSLASSSSSSEDDDVDVISENTPKQSRGRPRVNPDIKGFTVTEIRRFLKSMKKFGRPSERIEDIASDAELQEKSKADLVRLTNLVLDKCKQAMAAHEAQVKDEPPNGGSKQQPVFKLGKAVVNAKMILQAANDLEPLVQWMKNPILDHNHLPVGMHVKDSHFDCTWTGAEDASLLRGVYKYGLGNWEAMRMDKDLNLAQILPDHNLKPQAKHLQTRFDYLMRSLIKHANKPQKHPKVSQTSEKTNKTSQPSRSSKAMKDSMDEAIDAVVNGYSGYDESKTSAVDDSDDSKDFKLELSSVKKELSSVKKGKPKEDRKKKATNEKLGEKKNTDMEDMLKLQPVQVQSDDTNAVVDNNSELLPQVFAQCKDKMRPVKKALKQLGNPDINSSQEEHLEHTRRCLLKIGDHISELLKFIVDPSEMKDWRNNLWLFVSKFTDLMPNRLHKVYRHMAKKRAESLHGTTSVTGDTTDVLSESEVKVTSSNKHHHLLQSNNDSLKKRTNQGTLANRVTDRVNEWRHSSPLAHEDLSRHRSEGGYGRTHSSTHSVDRHNHSHRNNNNESATTTTSTTRATVSGHVIESSSSHSSHCASSSSSSSRITTSRSAADSVVRSSSEHKRSRAKGDDDDDDLYSSASVDNSVRSVSKNEHTSKPSKRARLSADSSSSRTGIPTTYRDR